MLKQYSFFSYRQLPANALYLWIILLLMAARLSVFVRRRAYGSYTSIDSMAAFEIVLVLLSFFFIMKSVRMQNVINKSDKGGIGFYITALGFGVLSCLWSPLMTFSAYRAISVISQFLAVLIVLSYENDFYQAEWKVLQAFFLVMLMQMIEIGGWTGFFMAPMIRNNTLGTSSAMVACYCLGEAFSPASTGQRRKILLRAGVIAFACIALGVSSGSNVAMLTGLLMAAVFLRRAEIVIPLFLLGICFWLFALPLEVIQEKVFPNKNEQQILTMSGRTGLWKMYLEQVEDKMLLGEGYAATARLAPIYSTNTHNSFISIYTGTGIVGTIIYAAALMGVFFHTMRSSLRRQPGAIGCLAGLVAGLTNSMTKAFIGEGYFAETLIFFLLFGLAGLHVHANSNAWTGVQQNF